MTIIDQEKVSWWRTRKGILVKDPKDAKKFSNQDTFIRLLILLQVKKNRLLAPLKFDLSKLLQKLKTFKKI